MIKDALEYLLSLATPHRENIDGLEYSSKNLSLVKPPESKAVPVNSLSGFVQLLEAGLGGVSGQAFDPADYFVHVIDHKSVQLVSRVQRLEGERPLLATVKPIEGLVEFNFNTYQQAENFLIAVASQFVQDDSTMYLLDVASRIDLTDSVKLEDSGVAQRVTMQQGVVLKEEKVLKPRISLRPFRTFREVEQPASDYVFRAKTGGLLALFEADGGKWKLDAIANVAAWLKNRLSTTETAGLGDIPVIH